MQSFSSYLLATWRKIYLTLLGLWLFLCGHTSPAFLGSRALLAMRPRKKDKGANTRPIKMPVTNWSLSQAYQRANCSQNKTIILKNRSLGYLCCSQRVKSRNIFTCNTFPYFYHQNLWQWPHTTNTLESLSSTRSTSLTRIGSCWTNLRHVRTTLWPPALPAAVQGVILSQLSTLPHQTSQSNDHRQKEDEVAIPRTHSLQKSKKTWIERLLSNRRGSPLCFQLIKECFPVSLPQNGSAKDMPDLLDVMLRYAAVHP